MKNLEIVKDINNILRFSHIYIAGLMTQLNGQQFILVDEHFSNLSTTAQRFIIEHEKGHLGGYSEFVADSHAMDVIGRRDTARAMTEITKYLARVDWTAAAEFIYRIDLLGFRRAKWFAIVAPNGRVFRLKDLKPFYKNDVRFGKGGGAV